MSTEILTQKRREAIRVGDKIVGYIEGKTFIKSVAGSRHKLRKPPAWAIDAEVFDSEIKQNATEILIIDKEVDKKYFSTVENFDRLKGQLNRGHGRQYYLTLNQWRTQRDEQLTLWGNNG